MRSADETKLLWMAPVVFGLLAAACVPLLSGPLARSVSPLAGIVILFAAAALLLLPTSLPSLLRDVRPSGRLLVRAGLTGALLLLAMTFIVLGLSHGADLVASLLFLSLTPTASLVGRKVLWGERLCGRQQAGILMSLVAAAVWLGLSKEARPFEGAFLPASRDVSFLGDTLVFLGSLMLGITYSVGRPSELRVSVTSWWFFVVGSALALSLPLAMGSHAFLYGLDVPFAGVNAARLREEPAALLPYAFFGMAHLFFRLRLLARSGALLSVGTSALLWCGALLLAGTLIAGLLGNVAPAIHFAMLPLHLFGLCLARDALVPWAPYAGPREARPVVIATSERAVS